MKMAMLKDTVTKAADFWKSRPSLKSIMDSVADHKAVVFTVKETQVALAGLERQVVRFENLHDNNVRVRMFFYTYSGSVFMLGLWGKYEQDMRIKQEQEFKEVLQSTINEIQFGAFEKLNTNVFESYAFAMKQKVKRMDASIEQAKTDDENLKKQVEVLMNEVGGIKEENNVLKGQVNEVNDRLLATQAQVGILKNAMFPRPSATSQRLKDFQDEMRLQKYHYDTRMAGVKVP